MNPADPYDNLCVRIVVDVMPKMPALELDPLDPNDDGPDLPSPVRVELAWKSAVRGPTPRWADVPRLAAYARRLRDAVNDVAPFDPKS